MEWLETILKRLSRRQLLILGLIFVAFVVLYPLLVPGGGTEVGAPAAALPTATQRVSETAALTPTAGKTSVTSTLKPTSEPRATGTPTRAAATATPASEKMSSFDYFVLSLSWSPDYCATSGENDAQQCSIGKKLGFVLHGLWPQNNQGYPSDCSSEKMTQSVKNQYAGLYPNDALFDHEWEKHGTCTGLTPARFLALSKQMKESVTLPAAYQAPAAAFRSTAEQLRQEFVKVNAGFPVGAFEANCEGSGRYLQEVYVCFSRAGQPQACGSEVHKEALRSCQNPDFLVRNVR